MIQRVYLPSYIYFSGNHDVITGLNAEESVAVTFHCILPKRLWEWNEESCMHIRFEDHSLGNWKIDIGDFQQNRYWLYYYIFTM